jgi:hypothetical protein
VSGGDPPPLQPPPLPIFHPNFQPNFQPNVPAFNLNFSPYFHPDYPPGTTPEPRVKPLYSSSRGVQIIVRDWMEVYNVPALIYSEPGWGTFVFYRLTEWGARVKKIRREEIQLYGSEYYGEWCNYKDTIQRNSGSDGVVVSIDLKSHYQAMVEGAPRVTE